MDSIQTKQAGPAVAARDAFLVKFADAVRPLTRAQDVTGTAAELLGRWLAAGQVAYADIDESGQFATIERDWNDGTLPSNVGRHRMQDFGDSFIADLKRGQTVVVPDVRLDPRTSTETAIRTFELALIGAFLNVPLIKAGRLVAVLAVHNRVARPWSPTEVELAEDVAERTWAAVERARAETLLRESEAALREREELLKEADRRKDEFLAILAHELRNPLAPVRAGLELLRLSGDTPESIARVRSMMERQVEHMVRLIDDLLDVSRITSGKIRLQRQRASLASLVDTAIDANRAALSAGALALQVDLPPQPVVLDVDPTRFVQVISNILQNAIKFTDTGGHIGISAALPAPGAPEVLALTVTDSGTGISPAMLPRVFDLFAQEEAIAPRARTGLGIGLSLARQLIQMHGGSIEAYSAGQGQGSAFTIRVPLPADTRTTVAARLSPEVPRTARRVVVIDDNTDAADSLAMLIEAIGGECRVAYDGPSGLSQVRTFGPDVVLLDIGMPGMNGYETCRRLRAEHGRSVYVVAVSGWGQDQDKEEAIQAGFNAHLTKPADPLALERLLSGTLA